MQKRKYYIGLRTIKTGIAVALAVLFAQMHNAELPMFAAIGAILGMNKTLYETRDTFRAQMVGILIGSILGCLLLLLYPNRNPVVIGLGVIVLIYLCNLIGAQFAVTMACIAFSCVLLVTGGDPLLYFIWRLIDTLAGILIALIVNALIKPYNNYSAVIARLRAVQSDILPHVETCVIRGIYPDISPLNKTMQALRVELAVFQQPVLFHKKRHALDKAYLCGCRQLAERMVSELTALCTMDTFGVPNEENCRRMQHLGLTVSPDRFANRPCSETDNEVLNYHLENLLSAYDYLSEMLASGIRDRKKS